MPVSDLDVRAGRQPLAEPFEITVLDGVAPALVHACVVIWFRARSARRSARPNDGRGNHDEEHRRAELLPRRSAEGARLPLSQAAKSEWRLRAIFYPGRPVTHSSLEEVPHHHR